MKGNLLLDEKISLCTGDGGESVTLKHFNKHFLVMRDGPHGVKGSDKIYPNLCLLACSWDKDLLFNVGKSLGNDCIEQGVDVLLAPGINLKRNPLCGRNFEYFSEDPLLTGYLAGAMINGIQSNGVCSCIKHYLANNQEAKRFSYSVTMNKTTLFELYLRAFKIAIRESSPKVLMTAYNRFDGTYCAENKYLLDLLKNELLYKGVIISDWGGLDHREKGVKAGLDMDMPGSSLSTNIDVVNAINSGYLKEEDIDRSVDKILDLLDYCRQEKKQEKSNFSISLATAESMVLLKNEKILPLDSNQSIAIVGDFAINPVIQGGGCAKIIKDEDNSIIKKLETNYTAKFIQGYKDGIVQFTDEDIENIKNSDKVLFFSGIIQDEECEGADRKNTKLPKEQLDCIKTINKVNKNIITILMNGSVVDLNEINELSKGLVECYYAGDCFSDALIKILSGCVNPCGRLTESFLVEEDDNYAVKHYNPMEEEIIYGEGINMGYRAYIHQKEKVLYPFGYGLSYSNFLYSNFNLDKDIYNKEDDILISLQIENTGNYDGKEVVQVYVENLDETNNLRQLKAFTKVFVEKNKKVNVRLKIKNDDLKYYDSFSDSYQIKSGRYRITAQKDANTIICEKDIIIQSKKLVNRYTTVGEIYNVTKRKVIEKYLTPYIAQAVWGDKNRKIKFVGDEIVEDNSSKSIMLSLQMRVLVSLTGGMLSNKELDKIINEINKEYFL